MGTGHLSELVKRSEQDNVQCRAVCDVFQRRLEGHNHAKDKVIETIDDCLNITMELGAGDPLRVNGEFAPEFKQKNDGYTEVRLARQERRDMKGNFIDVIRSKANCTATRSWALPRW